MDLKMSWKHYWRNRGHVPKTLVTEAGIRLDCLALAPWLRRSDQPVIESSSGFILELEGIRVDEEDHLVRSGRVRMPNGRKLQVVFSAWHEDGYRHRKRWFALCGVCGQKTTKAYLELAEVPVCPSCGRVRYVTESVTPSRRATLLALKAQLQVEADPEATLLSWRLRRFAALKVTRSEAKKKNRTMTSEIAEGGQEGSCLIRNPAD